MLVFKRLLIIICTLAISSHASDQADRKPVLTKESQPYYESGVKLFKEGCGTLVNEGLVVDAKLCLAAFSRLKQAVSINQTLVDANVMLSELYYYKPAQMNWGVLSEYDQNKITELGYRHTLKAIEYSPSHPKASNLLTLYTELRAPASVKTK